MVCKTVVGLLPFHKSSKSVQSNVQDRLHNHSDVKGNAKHFEFVSPCVIILCIYYPTDRLFVPIWFVHKHIRGFILIEQDCSKGSGNIVLADAQFQNIYSI